MLWVVPRRGVSRAPSICVGVVIVHTRTWAELSFNHVEALFARESSCAHQRDQSIKKLREGGRVGVSKRRGVGLPGDGGGISVFGGRGSISEPLAIIVIGMVVVC